MDNNNQAPTREQVKEFMRTTRSGAKIAQMLKAYFAANFKPSPVVVTVTNSPDQLYDFAKQLFSPVDNPGVSVAQGQGAALTPGP